MGNDDAAAYDSASILKLLDIHPHTQRQLSEYGDIGENAFDVYTLYKSAAKRKLSDIVEANDALDLLCLAWMTRTEFIEAKQLLRRLGYITEIVDFGEHGRPKVRYVKLIQRKVQAKPTKPI